MHENRYKARAGFRPSVAVLLASAAVAATLAVCLGFVAQGRGKQAGIYRPTGYYDRVEELVRTGVLVYLPVGRLPASERETGNPWGRIVFRDDSANAPQRLFHTESRRLHDDIERFNEEGSGGLFSVAGKGAIQVNRWAHNFNLPYPERRVWSGSFSFRGEKLPTLAGDHLMLAFAEHEEGKELRATERVVLGPHEWIGQSGRPHQRARGYDLLGADGQGAVLRFEVNGEEVVMECVEGRETGVLVVLNGLELNRGARDGLAELRERDKKLASNRYLLAPGDRLRVVTGGHDVVFRYGRFAGGMVSRNWHENGREVSRVDPELAREIPYLQDLHDAASRFVATHPDPGSVEQPAVRLSLNRTLHVALQSELDRFLDDFDRRLSAVVGIERQPAAIAVVDALDGNVLALPSYPSPGKLRELERLGTVGRIRPLGEAERARLARNQNFPPVVIGSTTKPLFALAVWDTHPQLRHLVVDEPDGAMSSILGHKLPRPLATIGPRRIGPVEFLGKSSNAYTATLGFATLADPASYEVGRDGLLRPAGGHPAPDFSRHLRGDLIPGGLDNPSLPAFAKLAQLFDISLRVDHAADDMLRYDPAPLEALLRGMGEPDGHLPRAFREVAPAATNLQLASIDTVRGEFISFLVGGFTNRWANLKLAEAYARIGSGRQVRARLVIPNSERDAPEFRKLDVAPEVLGMVHQGMAYAVSKGGTARRLLPAVESETKRLAARGLELRVIGKTGTARRTKTNECAALCLYVELHAKGGGEPLAAVACTIYLQDRADTRAGGVENSGVAALFANSVLPHLTAYLEEQPAVQSRNK